MSHPVKLIPPEARAQAIEMLSQVGIVDALAQDLVDVQDELPDGATINQAAHTLTERIGGLSSLPLYSLIVKELKL